MLYISDTMFQDFNYTTLYYDPNYPSLYENIYDNGTFYDEYDPVSTSIFDVHTMVKIKPPVECRPMPGIT